MSRICFHTEHEDTVSYLGNHEAFHAERPGDREFPALRWPGVLRRWCRERQCGLMWGHCFHRREGLARMLTRWGCCMCARVVDRWPADQCAFCEQDETDWATCLRRGRNRDNRIKGGRDRD